MIHALIQDRYNNGTNNGTHVLKIVYTLLLLFFLSNAPHVLYGLRGLLSWAWQNCNKFSFAKCGIVIKPQNIKSLFEAFLYGAMFGM